MISGNQANFGDASKFIDWDAHSQSQSSPMESQQSSDSTDETHKNITFGGKPEGKMTDTFLGQISDDSVKKAIEEAKNPESYKEAVDLGVGGGGLNAASKLAKPAIEKGIEYLKPISKKSIVDQLVKPHDALEDKAISGFEQVSKEVNKRGINNVPVSEKMIDNLKKYFPDTEESEKLLENAKKGDYQSLRNIQSDLFKEGKESSKSDLSTERMKGKEMFNQREKVINSISDHLKSSGNEDLDKILNQSRNDYKTLQDVYYNENMNNAIKKLMDKKNRKIPKNLSTILQEDSIPMKNLRDFHPGLEESVKKHSFQQKLKSKIGKYAVPAGLITTYETLKGK